jgi:aspartyl-tRNA(Asn)/glutamyl-tRNA(Gln) amidotransferase subunit A
MNAAPESPSVIAELAYQLRHGDVSSVELVARALTALETVVDDHHGLAAALRQRAMAGADMADRALARAATVPTNPLLGIPFAVKDAFAASGAATTWGSSFFRDQQLYQDARVVNRLEKSGSVLTAKLAMSELAGYGGATAAGSSLQGTALNPWDRTRYAGGSSGGSAVAVALDAVPYALGTEAAGSIVGPAAFCGVTGFRPTPGRLNRVGVLVLSKTLDKVGIIARTARDCAIVFAAARTASGADADREQARRYAPRIGFVTDEPADWAAGATAALAEARAAFGELGRAVPLSRDDLGDPASSLQTIMLSEAAVSLRDELADPRFRLLDAGQDTGLRAGADIPASRYFEALSERRRALHRFARVFERCDVIVCASRPDTARPLGELRASTPASVADLLRAAANLVGLPGLTVPCGLASDGMPLGLHMVGRRGADDLVLDLAAQYQRGTSHHLRRASGTAALSHPTRSAP